MFKFGFVLLSVLAIGLSAACSPTPPEFPNTETRIINAQNPTNSYKLFIFKPDTPAPENGYPVIYLLDGNSVFGSMVYEVKRRTALKYGDPAIVVAIGYPEEDAWNARRGRDLTPWPPATPPSEETSEKNKIIPGGADDFLTIIETQIIPAVEGDYDINPNRRTLAGHSYGGLFTLHAFFKKTGLFQNYAATSPSIWYAPERVFKELDAYAIQHHKTPDTARLYIMVGGCEETPDQCDPFIPAASPEMAQWIIHIGKMVTNAATLYDKLHAVRGDDILMRNLGGENHTSVIGSSLSWTAAFAMTSPEKTTIVQSDNAQ
ncbi:MAG: hypothetical protein COB36_12515 [Alphaproteobacteria bacterium]|nr:MAG: hypothetical protein COB36_12515 [Alphaproteobacteria bacterium]